MRLLHYWLDFCKILKQNFCYRLNSSNMESTSCSLILRLDTKPFFLKSEAIFLFWKEKTWTPKKKKKKKKKKDSLTYLSSWTRQISLKGVTGCVDMGVEKKKKGAMCTMVCAGSVTLSIRLDSAYQRPELFFFKRVSLALSTVQWVPCTIYRTHQTSFFNKIFIKMGLTALFTHLKIILL